MPDEPDLFDSTNDLLADLGMLDPADMRFRAAHSEEPLLYGLVMALACWDRVDRYRGWRTREQIVTAVRNMARAGRIPDVGFTDAAVDIALAAGLTEPPLVESDGAGRYRATSSGPDEFKLFGVGSSHYLGTRRKIADLDSLSPLEMVDAGNERQGRDPGELDAAQACYERAIASRDPDATAFAEFGLAQIAELRDDRQQAHRWYTQVAHVGHSGLAPHAHLWLANDAYASGNRRVASAHIRNVISSGDLLADAWSLRSVMRWSAGRRKEAITAMRTAIAHAGPLKHRLLERLVLMYRAVGNVDEAADAQRGLLDSTLQPDDAVEVYLYLMNAAGRLDDAIGVLREKAQEPGIDTGRFLVGVINAFAMRGDVVNARQALEELHGHWSVCLPDVAVRADLAEAMLAIAEGDDARGEQLLRALVVSIDPERRKAARSLLLATGESMAKFGVHGGFSSLRPLLTFLRDDAPDGTARWATAWLASLDA